MSRATMTARAAELPQAPIYGIGRYKMDSGHVDFEIGWPEFGRDIDWARGVLSDAGIVAGDVVLFTVAQCEAPWLSPVVRAAKDLGATCLISEVFGFDAGRAAWFLQSFPVKAVVGLGPDTVDGWIEKELSPAELLAGVDVVWARPGALDKLSEVGPRLAALSMLGPALAMGRAGEQSATVNPAEWRLRETDGSVTVTSVATRATPFDAVPTGVQGTVTDLDGGAQKVLFRGPAAV
ncbi:hypothetical protein JVX93_19205 [Mycolicibacterium boenickei]|nr:hypothetical protein JVX93_19205 [Mycolicibacterium boenickei]